MYLGKKKKKGVIRSITIKKGSTCVISYLNNTKN